ncbi:hypothetical protein LTR27_008373 [Elasticomyces elasticus]|nr:hypothetical protein LTR27_008373 [Elasticomyces elasticus]
MAASPFARGKASSLMAEFEATSSSPRGLAKLRHLEDTAVLLLFTPVMMPAGFLEDDQQTSDDDNDSQIDTKAPVKQTGRYATDPFEMLGKALSKQHRRVRHVPYVPSVGFTETHDQFLEKADAVIAVSCEPEMNGGASPGVDLETTLAKQAAFIGNVASELEEAGRQVPMVNLSFGGDEWENQVPSYSRIWVGPRYNAEEVVNVVNLIYGGSD